MSTQHINQGVTGEHAGEPVRVVLVGRTGLDAALRDDGSFEMVRARTPLEAVGEVAGPPRASRGMPTIVVVGQGGEPSGDRAPFVAALRQADPCARLVRIDTGEGLNGASGYDAVLDESATGETLRAIISGGPDTPEDTELSMPDDPIIEAEPKPRADEPPIVRSTGPVGMPGPKVSSPGDGPLVEMVQGERSGLVGVALRLIRERTGMGDLEFDESNRPTGTDGAPVTRGGKRYGVLRSATDRAAERLAPHAAWLASWLALHDRQQSLRRAAFTDHLTGAWNRRYFDGFLAAALDRAREARRTVTVLVFDIDEFKQYNDRFGHAAGDEILIETVRALKSSVRPSDRVCRIGGDEFAVIFDEPGGPREHGSKPPESVYVLAKRVQKQIGERKFPKLGADAPGELTISGGLAAYPWDGLDARSLLERADELACLSKRQGKNAVTLGPGAERVCRGAGGTEGC